EQLIETIRIYDRWGTIVFSENNYENPWDGTFKNVIVPTGIYTYLIKTSFENFKGSILIIY
ncbi:gliding motility-associated C-terminal domain-containing protein, partial [Persicitalea sp.]|uniref:T9SS type B sorting domain-containing protein n=1 Tax=Persicitalea sp. TaxID=3100273 RepID=UPI0035936ABD